ncbi:hypothetical protein NDU88_003883 [Pleurodeles waltl]|uniref:Uncharacterized protein n=1 Tax=Pleurodeles waltl TaxID=8319 RepID=A0AAV7W4R3_PLEWA|nr:hypothetical protein NDU88_003883 [Pleurodeles waltl]
MASRISVLLISPSSHQEMVHKEEEAVWAGVAIETVEEINSGADERRHQGVRGPGPVQYGVELVLQYHKEVFHLLHRVLKASDAGSDGLSLRSDVIDFGVHALQSTATTEISCNMRSIMVFCCELRGDGCDENNCIRHLGGDRRVLLRDGL